jgi:deoxyribodipyrimidine photo-lyase
MPHPPKTLILWYRKDLRLADHAALATAAHEGYRILPLYIREPETAGTGPLGAAQQWWLHHSLKALNASLEGIGSRLVLRSGPAEAVLAELIAETGASAVFWNRRYDPPGIAIDKALKADRRWHRGTHLCRPDPARTEQAEDRCRRQFPRLYALLEGAGRIRRAA